MPPAVIRRIVTELPSCVMLKHEDWPGLENISARCGSSRRKARLRPLSILLRQWRHLPGFRDWSAVPTAR